MDVASARLIPGASAKGCEAARKGGFCVWWQRGREKRKRRPTSPQLSALALVLTRLSGHQYHNSPLNLASYATR